MRVFGILFALTLVASSAEAMTITIDNGTSVTGGPLAGGGGISYDWYGSDDFHIKGGTFDGGGMGTCEPCGGGTQQLQYSWSGDAWGLGILQIGEELLNPAFFDGAMQLLATVSLPRAESGPFNVTVPFTGSGYLWAFPTSSRNSPPLRFNLTGSGTATFTIGNYLPDDPSLFYVKSARYDFGTTPTPVPEPATAVMLATGLVAIMRRRGVSGSARTKQ